VTKTEKQHTNQQTCRLSSRHAWLSLRSELCTCRGKTL